MKTMCTQSAQSRKQQNKNTDNMATRNSEDDVYAVSTEQKTTTKQEHR